MNALYAFNMAPAEADRERASMTHAPCALVTRHAHPEWRVRVACAMPSSCGTCMPTCCVRDVCVTLHVYRRTLLMNVRSSRM